MTTREQLILVIIYCYFHIIKQVFQSVFKLEKNQKEKLIKIKIFMNERKINGNKRKVTYHLI